MHKHVIKLTSVLCLAWMLSTGCTATSSEPAKPVKAAGAVEAVKSEECLITPPRQPVACTMQYDPVCGCDGKTYGNACMARGAGVPHSKPGACGNHLNQ